MDADLIVLVDDEPIALELMEQNFFELGHLIISSTFAQTKCDADLAAGRVYRFKGSIGSIDAFTCADPAVNIEQIAIDDLVSYHFLSDEVPDELPFAVLIQAPHKQFAGGCDVYIVRMPMQLCVACVVC